MLKFSFILELTKFKKLFVLNLLKTSINYKSFRTQLNINIYFAKWKIKH